MKTQIFIILSCLCGIALGTMWSFSDKPKVYPDLAYWLLDKAEEVMRNCDANSIEYEMADDIAPRLRKYIKNFRCDVNKDGIIDANDLNLVAENIGVSARPLDLARLKIGTEESEHRVAD